jgi:hypothetical protein
MSYGSTSRCRSGTEDRCQLSVLRRSTTRITIPDITTYVANVTKASCLNGGMVERRRARRLALAGLGLGGLGALWLVLDRQPWVRQISTSVLRQAWGRPLAALLALFLILGYLLIRQRTTHKFVENNPDYDVTDTPFSTVAERSRSSEKPELSGLENSETTERRQMRVPWWRRFRRHPKP